MIRKRVVSFLILAALFFPNELVNVYAFESTGAKLGEKYEKQIVMANSAEDTEDELNLFEVSSETEEDSISDKTEELLIPKTNSNYEVALAYEDGDYTYVASSDNYEDAVNKANEENAKITSMTADTLVVPVVIDTKEKSLAYTTEGIARCIKEYKDGEADPDYDVCNMFSDKELNNLDRIINQDYCSEMPLLDSTKTEALVYINGYKGWMNRDKDRCAGNENKKHSSDVRIEPINQVTNPSFYCVGEDGLFYHYISSKMDATEVDINTDEAKKIGNPPSGLKKGIKYLSYDGQYFYSTEERGISKTLAILTDDLKAGNFNNAVNSTPYYNYYLYLPFRSRTNYTAEELNKYIDYYISAMTSPSCDYSNSKLKGIGEILIENQNKYGVNALLTLSIAINESRGGTSDLALTKNNLFGLNAIDYDTTENASSFDSVEDCIETFCKDYISRCYANYNNYVFYGNFLGNKGYGANVKYAADPYWADKAANNACKIENYLSNKKFSEAKDYDYYQLFKYNKEDDIKDVNGNVKCHVNNEFISRSGEFVGSIGLMLCNDSLDVDGDKYNEIALDMALDDESKNDGSYNWNRKGYINATSIEKINDGKTNKDKVDLDKDGDIDAEDLSMAAFYYNNSGKNLNYMYDTNDDGIVDIYDLVMISSRL